MNKEEDKYWYFTTIFYCPICGREDKYKERRYSLKPEDPKDRITVIEHYDYCDWYYND